MQKAKLRYDEMQLLFAVKRIGKSATLPKIFKWVEQENEMQPPYAYVTICVLRELVENKFLSVTDSPDVKKVTFAVTAAGEVAYWDVRNREPAGMYNRLPD